MRSLIAAAGFTFAFGAAASALAQPAPGQTSADALRAAIEQCGPFAAAPTLPDGSLSTRGDMARGISTYNAWSRRQQTNLACRRTALAAFDTRTAELRTQALAAANANNTAEAARLSADVSASAGADAPIRAQYNTDAIAYNAVAAAWQASLNTYNARHPRN
jgi:hypothetical protein